MKNLITFQLQMLHFMRIFHSRNMHELNFFSLIARFYENIASFESFFITEINNFNGCKIRRLFETFSWQE